jgi:hypothetical protein
MCDWSSDGSVRSEGGVEPAAEEQEVAVDDRRRTARLEEAMACGRGEKECCLDDWLQTDPCERGRVYASSSSRSGRGERGGGRGRGRVVVLTDHGSLSPRPGRGRGGRRRQRAIAPRSESARRQEKGPARRVPGPALSRGR